MEFKAFPKIQKLGKSEMTITQKIHGTNAQIRIEEVPFCAENDPSLCKSHVEWFNKLYNVRAGSRNRWIFPEDDNYGFAAWVDQNKEALVEFLGEGTHYGEWAGPGINSGEGLEEKTFLLFDWWRYVERPKESFPPQVTHVPVLYNGPLDLSAIDEIMISLKRDGSKLAPGFMRPEGVVIQLAGTRYKKVFKAEETQWTKSGGNKNKNPQSYVDYSHLCQPIRLEKLLSKDEAFLREYPKSLPLIVKEYVSDLIEEDQINGDEDQVKAIKKGASKQIFAFVKEFMDVNHGL